MRNSWKTCPTCQYSAYLIIYLFISYLFIYILFIYLYLIYLFISYLFLPLLVIIYFPILEVFEEFFKNRSKIIKKSSIILKNSRRLTNVGWGNRQLPHYYCYCYYYHYWSYYYSCIQPMYIIHNPIWHVSRLTSPSFWPLPPQILIYSVPCTRGTYYVS